MEGLAGSLSWSWSLGLSDACPRVSLGTTEIMVCTSNDAYNLVWYNWCLLHLEFYYYLYKENKKTTCYLRDKSLRGHALKVHIDRPIHHQKAKAPIGECYLLAISSRPGMFYFSENFLSFQCMKRLSPAVLVAKSSWWCCKWMWGPQSALSHHAGRILSSNTVGDEMAPFM